MANVKLSQTHNKMQKIPKNTHPKYFPDLIDYINYKPIQTPKKNKKTSMEKVHDNALEKMLQYPEIIGFPAETKIEKEISLYDKDTMNGEVDLIITDPTNSTTYYVEYKCHNCENNKKKAKKQLRKAKEFAPEIYRNKIEKLLYIYENFKIEELTEKGWAPFQI